MTNLTDDLLLAQLEGTIVLDLKSSFPNKERRSYTLKTFDKDGAILMADIIQNNPAFTAYKSYCANLETNLETESRITTILAPSLQRFVDAGTLTKLILIGSKDFLSKHKLSNLDNDLDMMCPPKCLENNRTSISYNLSERYKDWLNNNNMKLKLMGKVLSFKTISQLTQKADEENPTPEQDQQPQQP